MKKSKRVRQRRAKPIVPVHSDAESERVQESILAEQAIESVVPGGPDGLPQAELPETTVNALKEGRIFMVPMATPYIPWYVAGRSKPGEVVRVKDDRGQVQVVIVPEGGLEVAHG